MPVLCSNLPYAREICGTNNFMYFNEDSISSLNKCILKFIYLKNKKTIMNIKFFNKNINKNTLINLDKII